jgi:hypothetical protein
MAIINENAGLMEDLVLLEAKGIALDSERIKGLAGKIKAQVQRADTIIKNMNRFAHSVDDFNKEVDIVEILELLTALSTRFASMRGVILKTDPSSGPVKKACNPYLLENLLWLSLDFAMDVTGKEKSLNISAERGKGCVFVKFTGLKGLYEVPEEVFPTEGMKVLLAALGADAVLDAGKGELMVSLTE